MPLPKAHQNSPVDLSSALQAVEAGMKKLLTSGINRKAVIILIAHETGIPMKTVSAVLDAAVNLSKWTR